MIPWWGTVLVSLSGALGGSLLTAWVAILLMRAERRLDRRALWYEEACRDFAELFVAATSLAARRELGLPAEEDGAPFIQATQRVDAQFALSTLYGSTEAVRIVDKALVQLAETMDPHETAELAKEAADELAKEARRHLKMAPIEKLERRELMDSLAAIGVRVIGYGKFQAGAPASDTKKGPATHPHADS